MSQYVFKRLLLMIPTLFGVVLLTFGLIQFVPGGPVEQAIQSQLHGEGGEVSSAQGQSYKHGVTEEQILALQKMYGFDQPLYVQFGRWCYRLFTFQFGESYFYHKEVKELILEKMPVSASLGVISFLLTYLICIPLGVMKAVRQGSLFDVATTAIVLVGYSIPGFVLGVFLMVLLGGGSFWDVFPLRGLTSDDFETLTTWGKILDYLHHLVLPVTCMTIGSFAVMTNLTRNSVIENIRQQYALTARAKGLKERSVIWNHVFRNSMIPLVTGFAGGFLAILFGSSLLIESLFSLDGLGLLSWEAVMKRDYPIVMANLFIFSLLYIVGNLLGDMMYVWIDPRISFDEKDEL